MSTDYAELYNNLEARLKIDRYRLDDELVAQPPSYQEAAKARAMAISRRDRARDVRERVKAEAYGRIRTRLESAGSKVTETMIANEMALDEDVQRSESSVRGATQDADLWDALVLAWTQRSYALKDLVQLHVTSYTQSASSSAGSAGKVRAADYDGSRKRLSDERKRRERLE